MPIYNITKVDIPHKRKWPIVIIVLVIVFLCIGIFIFVNRQNNEEKISRQDTNNIQEEKIEIKEEIMISEKTLKPEQVEAVKHIYNDREKKTVYLTFDDGPSKNITPKILDLLKQKNIKATFFLLGNRVELYPEIVKRTQEEGHYIANHGYSHVYSSIYQNAQNVLDEYNRTEQVIRNALEDQSYTSKLFRFPGGSVGGPYNEIKNEAKQTLEQNGIAYLDWNCLSGDSAGNKTKEKQMQSIINTSKGKNSIVILMHDVADKQNTYEILEQVIDYFQQQGYEFLSVGDISA